MRTSVRTITAAAILLGAAAAAHSQETPPEHPALKLELRRDGTGPQRPWDPLVITPVVINTSGSEAIPFLPPGDGSLVGAREPRATWRCWRQAPGGEWLPEFLMGGRYCGTEDREWRDEVVVLRPGDEHLCTQAVCPRLPEITATARYRFRMWHTYTAQPPRVDAQALGAEPLGRMCGVAPFTLTSEPIEILIEVPLRLEVRQVRRMPWDDAINLADYFEVTLVNISDGAVEVGANADTDLVVHVGPRVHVHGGGQQADSPARQLAPGERIVLLGAADTSAELPPQALPRPERDPDRPLIFRAHYHRPGWSRVLRSDDLPIDLPFIPPPPPELDPQRPA